MKKAARHQLPVNIALSSMFILFTSCKSSESDPSPTSVISASNAPLIALAFLVSIKGVCECRNGEARPIYSSMLLGLLVSTLRGATFFERFLSFSSPSHSPMAYSPVGLLMVPPPSLTLFSKVIGDEGAFNGDEGLDDSRNRATFSRGLTSPSSVDKPVAPIVISVVFFILF